MAIAEESRSKANNFILMTYKVANRSYANIGHLCLRYGVEKGKQQRNGILHVLSTSRIMYNFPILHDGLERAMRNY